MEWKEGNIATARKLYQKALSINSTSETAARCLQVTPLVKLLIVVSLSHLFILQLCEHERLTMGLFCQVSRQNDYQSINESIASHISKC